MPIKETAYVRSLRRRLLQYRIIGALVAALGVISIFLFYFQVMDSWLCAMLLLYASAMTFMVNASYQAITSGMLWEKANRVVSYILLVCVLAFIIYGFVSGNMRL